MRALLFLPHAAVTTLKTAAAFRSALWHSHVYGVILHRIDTARVMCCVKLLVENSHASCCLTFSGPKVNMSTNLHCKLIWWVLLVFGNLNLQCIWAFRDRGDHCVEKMLQWMSQHAWWRKMHARWRKINCIFFFNCEG